MIVVDSASNSVQKSKHLELSNTITSLDIFTNYSLQLTRSNKITHSIMFTTDESVPNAVRNVKINFTSPTRLSVIWDPPKPVYGIIRNYIVTWMLYDKRDCLLAKKVRNVQFKNVTTTTIELDNLQPYSIYNISVSAVTKKGQGDMLSIIGYTDATETIDINIISYNVTTLETMIEIGTTVDCENWNGPIYLNAYATCKSIWCDEIGNNASKQIQYKDTTTILNLFPYTNYTLEVFVYHNMANSISDYKKILYSHVMTQSSVPNRVPFAEVYTLSETSLSLRWSPPYPPTGILDSFKIKYHYVSKRHSTQQTVINSLSPCKIWTNMYCTTLSNLTSNQNYIISIAGRNQNISNYGLEAIITESTTLKVPEPPLNLQAFWDTSRILQLQWQHPSKTNGPIIGFDVIVNGNANCHKKPENLTYTYKTSFQCKSHSPLVYISIQTVNTLAKSVLLNEQFKCPVLNASLSSNLWITNVNTNSLTILIPFIQSVEDNSTLYVILLTTRLNNAGDCERCIGESSLSSIPLQKDQICWVIKHFKQIEYNEIEDREMTFYFTQMPEFNFTGEEFEAGILIVNEFGGQTSNNWFKTEPNLKMHRSSGQLSPTEASTGWCVVFGGIIINSLAQLFV